MRAIPTEYKGVRFRSRTEARWAVLLDGLGIGWRYEHEGFQLSSGWYVPDFWLPKPELWIEVKGQNPTERETALCRELAVTTGKDVALFRGDSCSWWFPAKEASPVHFWSRLLDAGELNADLLASLETARSYRFWDGATGVETEIARQADDIYHSGLPLVREEFAILAYVLHSVEFAALVQDAGTAEWFTVPALQAAAALAVSQASEGRLVGDAVLASLDSDRLRQAVLREIEEQDRAGRSRRDLELKLSHHRRIAEQEAALRKIQKRAPDSTCIRR